MLWLLVSYCEAWALLRQTLLGFRINLFLSQARCLWKELGVHTCENAVKVIEIKWLNCGKVASAMFWCLSVIVSERNEVHSVHCVFSKCEIRVSVLFFFFLFVWVLLQKESDDIVVDDGTFLSRCLIVALFCRHWGPECHREPLVPVGFSCVGEAQFW